MGSLDRPLRFSNLNLFFARAPFNHQPESHCFKTREHGFVPKKRA